jgi:hypothetical protein
VAVTKITPPSRGHAGNEPSLNTINERTT